MIASFDHIHIYTADLPSSLSFYRNVLGAELVGAIPNSHSGHNHVLLLAGQYLVFSTYPPGMTPQQPASHGDGALSHGFGVAHLGLNVHWLEPVITRLEDAGFQLHTSPRGEGVVRYVYFTAPDGVVIELTQYRVPAKLRPALRALAIFNKAIHRARYRIGKALIKGSL